MTRTTSGALRHDIVACSVEAPQGGTALVRRGVGSASAQLDDAIRRHNFASAPDGQGLGEGLASKGNPPDSQPFTQYSRRGRQSDDGAWLSRLADRSDGPIFQARVQYKMNVGD